MESLSSKGACVDKNNAPAQANSLHRGIALHHRFICLILRDCFQVSSRVFVQHQVSVGGRVVDKQGIQLGAFVYVVGESILYLLSPNNPNFDTKLGLLLFVRKARNDSHSGILTVGTKRQIYCMESVFFPNLTAIALRKSGFP